MSKRDLLKWKSGEMVAQVDADVLLYSCAFAAQKTEWYYPSTPPMIPFSSKKKLNDWCDMHGHDKTLAIANVIPEPFSHAKRAYDMTLAKIVKEAKADRYITYLTGSKNFRLDVCPDYKANRKHVAKPHHYAQLKEYIQSKACTIIVNGMEADDALGIAQFANHKALNSSQWSVICTIDKDLDMIRGMHYNWNTNNLYYQAGGDAEVCFYRQLIMGDPTDNIKGIPKKGKVAAEKVIDGSSSDPYRMYKQVRNMYFDYHNTLLSAAFTSTTPSIGEVMKVADADLNKNAQLLWIMRHPTEHWTPPTNPEVVPL